MNSIRAIQQLNKRELEAGINPEGSWHTDYRDTAFIYIGGLPFELSEGDVITIFSQFGEPVWIRLARDKETGKSKGFGWLKYEDQRSCDLAVDNLGGATVMDRVLKVDHTRYKAKDDEDMRDNTMGEVDAIAADEDGGRRKRQRTESESDSDDDRPLLPEEIELEKAIRDLDEEDPMKESMVKRLQEKAESAVKKYKKSKRKDKERERKHHRRHRSPKRERSREHDSERRRIKDRDSGDEERHRRRERRSRRERSQDGDRHNRRQHQDRRENSGDKRQHRSSRRPREGSSDREDVKDKARDRRDRDRRDRNRRDDSCERRRYSSEEDDHRRSHSKRSP